MNPGEVYEIERGPSGKPRYVVVVSREELNRVQLRLMKTKLALS
jgi:hypothetical protein